MYYYKLFIGVTCGLLTVPTDGNVKENGSLIGAVAEFTCNAGYVLIGASSIICKRDGNWSSATPICQSKVLSTYFQMLLMLMHWYDNNVRY